MARWWKAASATRGESNASGASATVRRRPCTTAAQYRARSRETGAVPVRTSRKSSTPLAACATRSTDAALSISTRASSVSQRAANPSSGERNDCVVSMTVRPWAMTYPCPALAITTRSSEPAVAEPGEANP